MAAARDPVIANVTRPPPAGTTAASLTPRTASGSPAADDSNTTFADAPVALSAVKYAWAPTMVPPAPEVKRVTRHRSLLPGEPAPPWVVSPRNVPPPPPADGLTLLEGLTEADALRLGDVLALGLVDALVETDGDSDAEGEIDALALVLLMISRTAKCTTARSSDVPDDRPTFRAPWPGVVSVTTAAPLLPKSIDCRKVLPVPAVGIVCRPVYPPAMRRLSTPVLPSDTDCTASVPLFCRRTILPVGTTVSAPAVTVTATAYSTLALLVRLTCTVCAPVGMLEPR